MEVNDDSGKTEWFSFPDASNPIEGAYQNAETMKPQLEKPNISTIRRLRLESYAKSAELGSIQNSFTDFHGEKSNSLIANIPINHDPLERLKEIVIASLHMKTDLYALELESGLPHKPLMIGNVSDNQIKKR